ncbi:hypothetical protein OAU52_00865 [bacterium]|nr:hypothetical protein [bacterium]
MENNQLPENFFPRINSWISDQILAFKALLEMQAILDKALEVSDMQKVVELLQKKDQCLDLVKNRNQEDGMLAGWWMQYKQDLLELPESMALEKKLQELDDLSSLLKKKEQESIERFQLGDSGSEKQQSQNTKNQSNDPNDRISAFRALY